MDDALTLPILDVVEQRVLGALMEKSKTTPDYYPMTLNALTAACNQKTSRKPVVNYEDQTVAMALNSLKKRGLISTATGGTGRVVKYKHNFAIAFPVLPSEVAIICLLLAPDFDKEELTEEPARRSVDELENRVAKLERDYTELKEAFDKLLKDLIG